MYSNNNFFFLTQSVTWKEDCFYVLKKLDIEKAFKNWDPKVFVL